MYGFPGKEPKKADVFKDWLTWLNAMWNPIINAANSALNCDFISDIKWLMCAFTLYNDGS